MQVPLQREGEGSPVRSELMARLGLSATAGGMTFMAVGVLLLASQGAIAKWLRADLHAGDILFWRGLFGIVPVLFLVWRAGGFAILKPKRPVATVVRALFNLAGTAALLTSFAFLPLASVLAVSFSSPLIVAALSGPCLRERVSGRCWLAVAVGFGGVLLITRPFSTDIGWMVLLPIAGAALLAGRDLVTRYEGGVESATTMVAWTVLASIVGGGGATAVTGFAVPGSTALVLLAVAAFIIVFGRWCVTRALRLAAAATVSPLKYTALVWGALLGWAVWGDVPDAAAILGAAIVVASGIYLARQGCRESDIDHS